MPVPKEPNDASTEVMALGLLWEVVGSEHPSSPAVFQGSECWHHWGWISPCSGSTREPSPWLSPTTKKCGHNLARCGGRRGYTLTTLLSPWMSQTRLPHLMRCSCCSLQSLAQVQPHWAQLPAYNWVAGLGQWLPEDALASEVRFELLF